MLKIGACLNLSIKRRNNMRDVVNILGVNIDKITAADALDRAEQFAKTDGVSVIYTPNPEIVMAAYEDEEFRNILNSSDMCVPDGIGVVYGAKMLDDPVPERVPGFELCCGLLERLGKTGGSVFMFGSKPGVADEAAEKLVEKYPGLKIAGTRNGYFKEEDEAQIVDEINASGADFLMVCLGAPKQEKWIHKYKNALKVKLCIGAGGSLDVIAGNVKRAPKVFIKLNLEWFYRLCKQPSRIGRFAALPKFILTVRKNKNK